MDASGQDEGAASLAVGWLPSLSASWSDHLRDLAGASASLRGSASTSALHWSVGSPEALTAGVPNFICGSRQQFAVPCSFTAK